VCRLHTSSYRSVRNLSNGLMQIRRFHGNRLSGVKALLRATPEKIWYADQSGTRHSSVVHILSLEISVRDVTRAPAFGPDPRYVVRETDDERASEISNEFYPEGRWAADEYVDSPERARNKTSRALVSASSRAISAIAKLRQECCWDSGRQIWPDLSGGSGTNWTSR